MKTFNESWTIDKNIEDLKSTHQTLLSTTKCCLAYVEDAKTTRDWLDETEQNVTKLYQIHSKTVDLDQIIDQTDILLEDLITKKSLLLHLKELEQSLSIKFDQTLIKTMEDEYNELLIKTKFMKSRLSNQQNFEAKCAQTLNWLCETQKIIATHTQITLLEFKPTYNEIMEKEKDIVELTNRHNQMSKMDFETNKKKLYEVEEKWQKLKNAVLMTIKQLEAQDAFDVLKGNDI